MTLAFHVCIACVFLRQGAGTAGAGRKSGHLNYNISWIWSIGASTRPPLLWHVHTQEQPNPLLAVMECVRVF